MRGHSGYSRPPIDLNNAKGPVSLQITLLGNILTSTSINKDAEILSKNAKKKTEKSLYSSQRCVCASCHLHLTPLRPSGPCTPWRRLTVFSHKTLVLDAGPVSPIGTK